VIQGADVVVESSSSDYAQKLSADNDGGFEASALAVGAYLVTVRKGGFTPSAQEMVIASGSAPVLHFQLKIGARSEQVTVSEGALSVNPEQMTPATIARRSAARTTQSQGRSIISPDTGFTGEIRFYGMATAVLAADMSCPTESRTTTRTV